MIPKYDSHEWEIGFLQLEAANAKVMIKTVIQLLESIGPLVTFAVRVNHYIVAN